MAYVINSVSSVEESSSTSEVDKTYIVFLNYTDTSSAETQDTSYATNASDTAEFNVMILQWIVDHPEFPITPYVEPEPPTIEEIRAAMPQLTKRQIRLALINNGIMPSQAQSIIDAMPSGIPREKFNVEWNDSERFRRLSPTAMTMLSALLFTPEDIDTLWMASTGL